MDNIQPVMTPDGTNMFAQGEEKYQFVTQRYYYFPEQSVVIQLKAREKFPFLDSKFWESVLQSFRHPLKILKAPQ